MLRVALTGGAASGKSAVAAMLRELGALLSQSDEVARAMMQPGQPVYDRIVQQFGPGVVRADGSLDRRTLATLAFQDGRLQQLNAIVHPAVIAAQTAWLQQMAAEHPRAVAVVESALVLETAFGAAANPHAAPGATVPWRDRFDVLVLVTAPAEHRLARYVQRVLSADPGATREAALADAHARFAAQMPDAQKRALADVVLQNEGSLELLRTRVEQLYRRLLRQADPSTAEPM